MTLSRRHIMAATAASFMVRPALADAPVIDFAAIVKSMEQIQVARQSYEQITHTVTALTSSLDVRSLAPSLSGQARNPLGGIAAEIPSLMNGSALSGSDAQEFQRQDRIYQPAGTDLVATSMNGTSTRLANLKAVAMQLIGTNTQRIQALDAMQNDLSAAPDVSQVARINGRLEIENQTLAAQRAQAEDLQRMAQVEEQVQRERYRQKMRDDDDAQIEDTKPGAGNNPQPTGPVSAPTFVGG